MINLFQGRRKIKNSLNFRQLSIIMTIMISFSPASPCSVSNCLNCVSGNTSTCQNCSSGFNPVNFTCCNVGLSNCTSCSADSNKCDDCIGNQSCLTSNGTCSTCSTINIYCLTCSNCSVCTSCSSNAYALNSTFQCQLCPLLIPNCTNCTSSTVCANCIDNTFTVNTTSNQCVLCSSYMDLCQSCNSTNYCLSCSNNTLFFNSSQLKCIPCAYLFPMCSTCSNSSACTGCTSNISILNSTFQCQLCSQLIPNCSNCSSSAICLNCVDNTFVVNITSKKCVSCSAYITNCQNCTSITACVSCANNYIYNSSTNQCILCSSYMSLCEACNTPNFCVSCANNTLFFNSSQLKCISCSTCTTLPPQCSSCQNCSVCTSCTPNIYALNSTLQCQLCSQLMPNCTNCSSSTVCINCIDNSLLVNSTSKKCVACSAYIQDCLNCTSTVACLSCANSSIYNNSTLQCSPCSSFMDLCNICNSTSFCNNCTNITHYFNSSLLKCVSCSSYMPLCLNCSSSTVCISCVNDTLAFENYSIGCTPCPKHLSLCVRCYRKNACRVCINTTYGVNLSDWKCALCNLIVPYCTSCYHTLYCMTCIGAPNIILFNYTCASCSSPIPNCKSCTTISFCILCNQFYALVYLTSNTSSCTYCGNLMLGCSNCSSSTVCTRCSLGNLVLNGCSAVPGCKSVVQKTKSAICSACNTPEFSSFPINGGCTCSKGHLAGQYCTQIMGCTRIQRTNLGDVCTECSLYYHFYLLNGICLCQQYYQPFGQQCTEICGDGILIVLPCDDGNQKDGDGCSSKCQIQQGYRCKIQLGSTFSSCIYQKKVSFNLQCIYKSGQSNSGLIIFKMVPYISNIHKPTYNMSFDFSSNASLSLSSFQFVEQKLNIYFDYREDVEGQEVSFTFVYDHNYILNPPKTFKVQLIECNGDILSYSSLTQSSSSKKTITLLVKILCVLALVTFVLSSYTHKMIGVQLLHTFQLSVIMQVFAKRYIPVGAYFYQLSNSIDLYSNDIIKSSVISSIKYHRLGFSSDFIYNFAVIGAIEVIIVGAYFLIKYVYRLYYYFFRKGLQRSTIIKQLLAKQIKYKEFLYNFLIFPFFIGFFITLSISMMVHQNVKTNKIFKSLKTEALLGIFTFVSTSLIFAYQWKFLFVQKENTKVERQKSKYIPIYLTYIFAISMIIKFSILQYMHMPIYVMGGVTIFFTFLIIVYWPYCDVIHNIGFIINQITVLINLAWLISQNYIDIGKAHDQYVAFVLIAMFILVIIIALARTIYQLKKIKTQIFQQSKPKMQQRSFKEQDLIIVTAVMQQTSKKFNQILPLTIHNNSVKQESQHSKRKSRYKQYSEQEENCYNQYKKQAIRQLLNDYIDISK